MIARVTLATLRRLDKVASTVFKDNGERRAGVMKVPPILPAAEWEALAVPVLQALARAAAQDIDRSMNNEAHRTGAQALAPAVRTGSGATAR